MLKDWKIPNKIRLMNIITMLLITTKERRQTLIKHMLNKSIFLRFSFVISMKNIMLPIKFPIKTNDPNSPKFSFVLKISSKFSVAAGIDP